MYRLEFAEVHSCANVSGGISVPLVLRSGSSTVRLPASVDTGAACCIFLTEPAAALGLDLEKGVHRLFRTANSNFEAFGHERQAASVPCRDLRQSGKSPTEMIKWSQGDASSHRRAQGCACQEGK